MRAIRKILVANRGEIALRIMRTCREMGIGTIAVYSDADRTSPHVLAADEAVAIGPAPSRESYLSIERIVRAASATGADAVHPGYGFLSENPLFAQAVSDAGLLFIGPPAGAIRAMGDKTAARALAAKAGVPTVPGTPGALRDAAEARDFCAAHGYPVLVKAAAGGGGKGMRIVKGERDLDSSLRAAASEARSAFGDERVFLEKYFEAPRHIEIQVLADAHGNAVHLGERECSIQRRHQKVIEESPSVVVDDGMRSRMGETALRVARSCGYVNAGTVEFLVDRERNFYFLEMNTRLQVEHPVTELRTGLDLVALQIRIAAGEKLPLGQEDVAFRGHAIECRI
ncbi:MAG TPA: biotin carboxylase N-terminal domain-containing protein, partial [Bacteroidota bacterium]|nr:biotin carboxylase N-terminal domain-containing protein [Bacteroidota bacterium]